MKRISIEQTTAKFPSFALLLIHISWTWIVLNHR